VSTVALTSALKEMKAFNARRKFKAAVQTVKAVNRYYNIIVGVRST
jgi:hypothetical protein